MFNVGIAHMLNTVGLVGVALYIGSYGALQFGFLRGNGYAYTFANLAASFLVLVSLANAFNLSSAIIQVVWICISIYGIVRMAVLDRRANLNDEERAFITAKFPTMSRMMARSFLNAGEWCDGNAGTRLATEGERLGALIYLANGGADVMSSGEPIARCPPSSFIGELTCLDGSPAIATVVLNSRARYFRISTEALKRLGARDFDMRLILQTAIGSDTRDKLVATNRELSGSIQGSRRDPAASS